MSELLSKGVAMVSGEDVSESSIIGCDGDEFEPNAMTLCSADEGVEALVVGRGEYDVDGEGALDILSSRIARFGFAEESYGFVRFFELPIDAWLSFLRLEGARASGLGEDSLVIPPTWGHSE